MLSMPPALARTTKSKAIKRSSVGGMGKRLAVSTAKSGAVETCGNRKAVDESMLAPVHAEGSASCKSYHKCNSLMQKHMPTEAVVTIT